MAVHRLRQSLFNDLWFLRGNLQTLRDLSANLLTEYRLPIPLAQHVAMGAGGLQRVDFVEKLGIGPKQHRQPRFQEKILLLNCLGYAVIVASHH